MNTITTYDDIRRRMQTVKPSMSVGGEFGPWQTAARKKLAELLGMDRFTAVEPRTKIEYENKIEGAMEIRFEFYSEDGYTVPCHMLLPDGVENPPVMICLQGHSTGMHISLGRAKYPGDDALICDGDRDFCLQAAREGFAAIAVEQRNFGERSNSEKGEPMCYCQSTTALLMGRTTIGERVWDIQRLIDVLERDFVGRVDAKTVCCMGNSGGGTATIYAAALEDRIKLAMPSCSMAAFKDSIGAMHHCACNFVPHIAEYFDMSDLMAMAYPKYYVQVSGKEDPIFPIATAKAMYEQGSRAYEAQGGGDRCTLIIGEGGHRFYQAQAWPVVKQYLKEGK